MKRFITLLLALLLAVIPLIVISQEDCTDAIDVCTTKSFSGNSSGSGTDDFSSGSNDDGCLFGENQSAWYRINVTSNGVLDFVITPNGNSDYDFALYESDDCGNLGSPVRCSYAAAFCYYNPFLIVTCNNPPNLVTGLNSSSTQQSENVSGDGFVDTVNVSAGQTYYLLIDNFSADSLGYTIDFTSTTAGLSCNPLPLSYLSFNVKEIGINSAAVHLVTQTEYNVSYHVLKKRFNLGEDAIAIDTILARNEDYNIYDFVDSNFDESSYYMVESVDYDRSVSQTNLLYLQKKGSVGISFSSKPSDN